MRFVNVTLPSVLHGLQIGGPRYFHPCVQDDTLEFVLTMNSAIKSEHGSGRYSGPGTGRGSAIDGLLVAFAESITGLNIHIRTPGDTQQVIGGVVSKCFGAIDNRLPLAS